MSHLIEMKVGDALVFVEVDDDVPLQAAQLAQGEMANAGDKVERVAIELADLGATISSSCKAIFDAVKSAADELAPDELTLEFGLMLGGEAGVPFVAKGKAEANVAITMKWDLAAPSKQSGRQGAGAKRR